MGFCLWNCSSALESVATEIKRYKSGIRIMIVDIKVQLFCFSCPESIENEYVLNILVLCVF